MIFLIIIIIIIIIIMMMMMMMIIIIYGIYIALYPDAQSALRHFGSLLI